MESPVKWSRNDYSRIPNVVYHSPNIYQLEMQKVFQGDAWLFMGFEAEVPQINDFRTTYLGEVPVVFNRVADGSIHAFVNRCAHRGSLIRREPCGNEATHTCIYHQWCYNQEGKLIGVPFQRGLGGEGGLPRISGERITLPKRFELNPFMGCCSERSRTAWSPYPTIWGQPSHSISSA